MKRLCSICARGGSKGVLNKNLRLVAGVPLIAHSLRQAQEANLFDCIAVSSDSDEILNVAQKYGASVIVKRPEELATDTAAKLPVIRHCFEVAQVQSGLLFDTIVDLDCTSPLRSTEDICAAVKFFENSESAQNLITGTKARRSPYFNQVRLNDQGFVQLVCRLNSPIVRRQDAPICFDMNASIYIWNQQSLREADTVIGPGTIFFEMPEERSLDIDSEFDFKIVSYLMEGRDE